VRETKHAADLTAKQAANQDQELAIKWAQARLRRAGAAGERKVMITPRLLSVLVQAACAAHVAVSRPRAAA